MSEHEFVSTHVSSDPEYAFTPPGAGYEHTDANVWIIVKFGIWLAISAAIIHVGILLMFRLFVDQRQNAGEAVFPLANTTDLQLPAEPRLQRFPANESYEFRLQQEAALETYGWVDRTAGTVRLPISEAMRLTVERGLPVRAAAPAAAPAGQEVAAQPEAATQPHPAEEASLMPADSSSGRTMERRRQ